MERFGRYPDAARELRRRQVLRIARVTDATAERVGRTGMFLVFFEIHSVGCPR